MVETAFLEPAEQPRLDADEVHVWRVALTQSQEISDHLRRCLAPDELARASRFHFDQDRAHFIVGRAALRSILGGYLAIAPERVEFVYGPQGKPALVEAQRDALTNGLEFNLAHSHGLALCALTCGKRVGVDLEQIRPMPDAEQIAERFFSPTELTALRQVTEAGKPDAFFRCWTRKEAFIKADGQGLSMPLDSFDVSLDPQDARLLRLAGDAAAAARWRLATLRPAPDFVAALAVEGASNTIRLWQFLAR